MKTTLTQSDELKIEILEYLKEKINIYLSELNGNSTESFLNDLLK